MDLHSLCFGQKCIKNLNDINVTHIRGKYKLFSGSLQHLGLEMDPFVLNNLYSSLKWVTLNVIKMTGSITAKHLAIEPYWLSR